jgi:LemA protein
MRVKTLAIGIVVIAIIVGASFAALYITTYNNLVTLKVATEQQWANVETQLQRRYDLIPNVVAAARGYMTYEGSILENITLLRTQWLNAMSSGNVTEIGNATNQMEVAMPTFIATVENYPTLAASSVVQDLIVELEGTENRISVERTRFNDDVAAYNTAIMVFPANMLAPGWGFTTKSYFQAQNDAYYVPPVNLTG